MTAQKLAEAILAAIKRGELNADAGIVLAEEIMPGNFSFHGTATKIMHMPGEEKTCLYLVAGMSEDEEI